MKYLKITIVCAIAFVSGIAKSGQDNYGVEYSEFKDNTINKSDYIKLRENGYQPDDVEKLKDNIFDGEVHFNHSERLNRLLVSYRQKEKKSNNIEASSRLESEGRSLYIKNNHAYLTYSTYDTAMAWLPRPEYFLVLGDISFRILLDSIIKKSNQNKSTLKCMNKYQFAYEGKKIIIDYYEIGFGLADKLQIDKFKNTSIYKQSREKMACLDLLVSQYGTDSAKPCIAPEKLKFCLGDPLILDPVPTTTVSEPSNVQR